MRRGLPQAALTSVGFLLDPDPDLNEKQQGRDSCATVRSEDGEFAHHMTTCVAPDSPSFLVEVSRRWSNRPDGFTKMSADEKYLVVCEENQELHDHMSNLEENLRQAVRELEVLRQKVRDYEHEEAERAEEAKAREQKAPRMERRAVTIAESARNVMSAFELDRLKDAEHQLREKLVDLEGKYTESKAESERLRAEVAKAEKLSKARLEDIKAAQESLAIVERTLEHERELLNNANEENRYLQDELLALRSDEQRKKMVVGRHGSLALPATRRQQKFVTSNLLSQLADMSREMSQMSDDDQEGTERQELQEEQDEPEAEQPSRDLQEQLEKAKGAEIELRRIVQTLEDKLALLEKIAMEWKRRAQAGLWERLTDQCCATRVTVAKTAKVEEVSLGSGSNALITEPVHLQRNC